MIYRSSSLKFVDLLRLVLLTLEENVDSTPTRQFLIEGTAERLQLKKTILGEFARDTTLEIDGSGLFNGMPFTLVPEKNSSKIAKDYMERNFSALKLCSPKKNKSVESANHRPRRVEELSVYPNVFVSEVQAKQFAVLRHGEK
ncbi:hypothetical protein Q3G72_016233 [Acer saccharum]|nr:hypothetical protein Q3G72_016233 [Acer saccharum]